MVSKELFKASIHVLICIGIGSCSLLYVAEPANHPEALFENFWQSFNDDYAAFEERNIDWNNVYNQYRPRVNAETSEIELYNVLSEMIKPINDGHVALMAMPHGSIDANNYFREKTDDALFSLELVRSNYLHPDYKMLPDKYVYGKIDSHNIAYIFFDVFRADAVMLDAMLKDYPDVNGYIVDLRHNGGGDVSYSFSFLGRFITGDTYFLRSKTKNGKGPNDYTSWYNWHLTPSGSLIKKPLILLTDRYTVSAAERMVMAARALPNTLVVGDTTNGTFGTKISRELANGWFYSYSIQKVEMFDGKNYEGIGLPPDVWVKNDLQEMDLGIDRTLQYAINLLK